MTSLSTHVLDTALGRPAAGVRVELAGPDGPVATVETDDEGQEQLRELGRLTLWQGAQPIAFRELA